MAKQKMNQKDISRFELLQAQIHSLYLEIQALAKKSPNDGLNKFKVRLVNGLLRDTNAFLTGTKQPVAGFTEFDENDLPSNSDALMVVAQYLTCLETFRSEHVAMSEDDDEWYWVVNGRLSDVLAEPPKKFVG